MQLLLRWLDMLARNPKGTDDVKAVTGVLPPVQKLVLQLLGQINMVSDYAVMHGCGCTGRVAACCSRSTRRAARPGNVPVHLHLMAQMDSMVLLH